MRVLHLTNKLTIGGKQRFLLSLCRAASGRGIEFSVLCFSSLGELVPEFERLGVEVRLARLVRHGYGIRAWLSFLSFARVLKKTHADIYHIHGYPPLLRVGLACALLKLPFVVQYHSCHPAYRKRLWLFFEKFVLSRARHAFFVSHAVRESVVRRCFVEPPGTVIHNCPDRRSRRGEKKWDAVWVARLSGQKRPLDFVEAVKRARDLVDIKALVVGGGELLDEAKRIAEGAVEFTGFVKDVEGFLASSRIGAFTSEREGIGISVLEYLAFGLPVVAYRLPALSEVVPEKVGRLFPVGDVESLSFALVVLKLHPALRKRLSVNAARLGERFSCGRMAGRYVAVYRRLL